MQLAKEIQQSSGSPKSAGYDVVSSTAPQLKYLFKPLLGSSHSWAIEQCRCLPRDIKVLDFGAGGGGMGSTLRDLGFTDLTGIEIDARAREHIAPIYKEVAASLDEVNSSGFGLILVLDVLEHLVEPEAMFSRLAGRLKPGGLMLVSVPNIAHWSMRLLLLLGRFDYTERGLLDRTHLSHFTRRRIASLVKHAPDLELLSIGGSISPAEFVLPRWLIESPLFTIFSKIRLFGVRVWPGLCAYQHLAIFRRKN